MCKTFHWMQYESQKNSLDVHKMENSSGSLKKYFQMYFKVKNF